jgi:hypothetical protein
LGAINLPRKFRVTAVNVQEKIVDDQTFNTPLAAKTFAEVSLRSPKVKLVRINGKVFKKAR